MGSACAGRELRGAYLDDGWVRRRWVVDMALAEIVSSDEERRLRPVALDSRRQLWYQVDILVACPLPEVCRGDPTCTCTAHRQR